ncbi:hypothetical protein QUF70_16775 [Desulfobacterales bacterium HSG17]|nr:hypothetical protein [Desulfobacterales bacterium HSG17]
MKKRKKMALGMGLGALIQNTESPPPPSVPERIYKLRHQADTSEPLSAQAEIF